MKLGTMCYLREEGKTLFLNRNAGEGDIHNGFYVPPGGGIKQGERGIDSVIREFKEETGLRLINPRLKFIINFDNRGRILGGKENQEDHLVYAYTANLFTGVLEEEQGKNAKPVWVADKDLEDINMYPADRELMNLLHRDGILEVLVRYNGKDLAHMHYHRVD